MIFEKTWGALNTGVIPGETVAYNFSKLNKLKQKAGLIEKNIIFFSKENKGTEFYDSIEEMEVSSEYGFKKFIDNKKFSDYLEKCNSELKMADKVYLDFLKIKLNEKSKEELLELFKNYLIYFKEIYTFFHACQPQYFHKIEAKLKEDLNKKCENESHDVLLTLTSPEEFDVLSLEELEWLNLVKKIKTENLDDKKTISIIKKHSDKYLYLGTVETNSPWNIEHYQKLLSSDLEKDVSKIIKEKKDKKKKLKEKKEMLIKKYSINKDIIQICNSLAKIGNTLLAMRFGWTKISYAYIKILEEIVKKVKGLSGHEWDYKLNEIEDAVLKNKFLSNEEIKNRKQAFIFYVKNEEIIFLSGKKALELKEELVPEQKIDISEIKGQIACKGKVIGRVIFFSWIEKELVEKMNKMKHGDILVAGQTRPFLMPAIRKAGAIITDEGGITSHAAIVSRELGVPCIIGTKIATKVLHDGDLVEVDANNGIVRIIERAN